MVFFNEGPGDASANENAISCSVDKVADGRWEIRRSGTSDAKRCMYSCFNLTYTNGDQSEKAISAISLDLIEDEQEKVVKDHSAHFCSNNGWSTYNGASGDIDLPNENGGHCSVSLENIKNGPNAESDWQVSFDGKSTDMWCRTSCLDLDKKVGYSVETGYLGYDQEQDKDTVLTKDIEEKDFCTISGIAAWGGASNEANENANSCFAESLGDRKWKISHKAAKATMSCRYTCLNFYLK